MQRISEDNREYLVFGRDEFTHYFVGSIENYDNDSVKVLVRGPTDSLYLAVMKKPEQCEDCITGCGDPDELQTNGDNKPEDFVFCPVCGRKLGKLDV